MNDPPIEERCDAESSAKPVATSSMQSPANQKNSGKSDISEYTTEQSEDASSDSSFAQTRSPPPIVDTEQASKQSSPFNDDRKSGSVSPTPGASPFSHDFSLANTNASFFSTRRVTPILRLRTTSEKTARVKKVAPRSTRTEVVDTTIGDITSKGLGKALSAFQESIQADVSQEEDTTTQEVDLKEPASDKSEQEIPQKNGTQDKTTNMQEIVVAAVENLAAVEATMQSDVINRLEEVIDQQLPINEQHPAMTANADPVPPWSAPAPFIPPFEEPKSPQTSWGISTWKAIEMPQIAETCSAQSIPHPLSVEITLSPSTKRPVEKQIEETLVVIPHEGDVPVSPDGTDPSNTIDGEQDELSDATVKDHSLAHSDSVTPQKDKGGEFTGSTVLITPERIAQTSVESPDLLDPPTTSKHISAASVDESTSIHPNIWIPDDWPLDLYHQDQDNNEHPASTAKPTKIIPTPSSSTPTCHQERIKSVSPTVILSSPTNASDTGLGLRLSNILGNNDVFTPEQPERLPTQINISLDQQLREFKTDFLKELNLVLSESANKWNTARNSNAATILARPSINEALKLSEVSIKDEIAEKQSELLSKMESINAGYLDRDANTAKIMKRSQRALAESLKNVITTINANIDQRFDELKDSEVIRTPLINDESVHKEVQNSASLSDKDGHHHDIGTLSTIIEQMKSVLITSTEKLSDGLDRSHNHAKAEQNENVAVIGAMQRGIIENLREMLQQSSLQNRAINHLAATVAPLANLIKGISHDTTFIDAKLAKNAAILTTMTEQVDKLDRTAGSFDKIIRNAAVTSRLENVNMIERLESQITKLGGTASSTAEIATKVENLQDQISGLEQQLSQIVELRAKRSETERVISNERNALTHRPLTEGRGSESGYSSAAQSNSSERPDSPVEPPTISVRTTFMHKNQSRPDMKVSSLPHLRLSDLNSIMTVITKTRSFWTKYLVGQGVFDAEIELLLIKVPATDGSRRQLVDNQTAYDGWYKAATTGCIAERRPLLELEFLVLEKVEEEPRRKKRKHDQMRRDSESGLEFRLAIWKAARQSKY